MRDERTRIAIRDCAATPEHGSSEDVGRLLQEIRRRLEEHKTRINQELRNYPPPITACDQQFNYLLELRASLESELSRLAASAAHCDPANAKCLIDEFVSDSRWMDADALRTIRAETCDAKLPASQ